MLIKVSSLDKQPVGFWNYSTFGKIHGAVLRTCKRTGCHIDYAVFEIGNDKSVDSVLASELNLRYCIVKDIYEE